MSIRILTIDDHPMLREGIAAMLETAEDLDVVGGVADAESGLHVYPELRADVVLMDLQMPGMGGLAGVKAFRQRYPAARVIVLTTFRGDANARDAMAAGACGYLLKSALRQELIDCVRRVHGGGRYVSPEVCADIATHLGGESLTEREQHILELLAEGLENKRIGTRLAISPETVKSHLTRIFEKLGAHNRTEAIRIATRRGVLRPLH